MKNYYEILEVSNKASEEIIEKSYKVLAKKYHPDLQNEATRFLAEETLKDINEAYSVLSDPHLRQAYDREYNQMYANKNVSYNYKKHEETKETEKQKSEPVKDNKQTNSGMGITNLIANMINSFKSLKDKDFRDKQAGEFSQKLIAIVLTIVIMAAIILILWNIPLTRSWITGV